MGDYPRFFSKNYMQPRVTDFQDDLSNIIATHGSAYRKFLYDRNINTQWVSEVGSRDDLDVIDNCDDDPVAWVSADAEVTVTRDTSVKQEGTASVRLQFSGSWAGGLAAYHNLDIGNVTRTEFLALVRHSSIGDISNLKFVVSVSENCATLDEVYSFGSGPTGTFVTNQWTPDWSSLGDVKSIGIYDDNVYTNLDLRVDYIRISQDPEEIEIQFYEGSVEVDRTINTFLLQNINLKEFKLQYEDSGGSWQNVTGAVFTDNALTRILVEFSDITTGRMKLIMNKTITKSEEKKIGEFWLLDNLYDLTDAMDAYRPATLQKQGSFRLSSFNDTLWWLAEKYKATVGLKRITLAELGQLKAIYDPHEPFVWFPEPESRPNEIYLVNWKSPWSEPYSSKYKGLGYDVSMVLEEV